MPDSPLWRQFRRLLLGAVVELLLDAGIVVEFASLRIDFEDDSVFRVPRLDNYMRFVGTVTGRCPVPPDAAAQAQLRARMTALWHELLSVVELPIGDKLTNDRAHVDVRVDGDVLTVRFDLAAD